jgi:outer membrane receptor protein involved in Fe transport
MLRLSSRSFCVAASVAVLVAFAPSAGATIVNGRVLDSTNGLPLAGAEVWIDGQSSGLSTDADGRFRAEVEGGERLFTFRRPGYVERTLEPLAVPAEGEIAAPEARLAPTASDEEIVMLDALEVQGEGEIKLQVENRAIQQETAATINIVSVEDFSKFAIGDMSDALKTIPGVTVAEGKYAVIRGLGDRYTSTSMNGLPLASPDPDRQAVQMDIFPSSLFENIVVSKTFTPDLPGTATGGVDLKLKSVPDDAFVNLSVSLGYHSVATGNENFLTNDRGSGGDRWASGADERALPAVGRSFPANLGRPVWPLPTNPPANSVFISRAARAQAVAETEAINDGLDRNYHASGRAPGPDYGAKLSFGDRYIIGQGVEAGFVAGLNYGREFRMIEDGEYFRSTTATSGSDTLSPEVFVDPARAVGYRRQTLTESTVNSSLSWLLAGGLEFGDNHSFSLSRLNLQNSEDENSRLLGDVYIQFPFSGSGDQLDTELRESLHYTERTLISDQIGGAHRFGLPDAMPRFEELNFDWRVGHDLAKQSEPGFVQTSAIVLDDGSLTIARNSTSAGTATPSYVIWREIEESRDNRRLDLEVKDTDSQGFASAFKVGYLRSEAERSVFDEFLALEGDTLSLTSVSNTDTTLGNINATPGAPGASNDTRIATNYAVAADVDLDTENTGRYFLLDQALFERFRVIGGYRYEENNAEVRVNRPLQLRGAGSNNPLAGLPTTGGYDDDRWLPSLTLSYQPDAFTNIRFAFSRTLALPSAREVSPYASSAFAGSDVEVGNLAVDPSEVENLDLGFSRFNEAGDLIGATVFRKNISGRIERLNGLNIALQPGGDPGDLGDYSFVSYSQNLQAALFSWYNNPDDAVLEGIEIEARKNLGFLGEGLESFSFGGNLALIKGEVERFPIEIAAKNFVGRPVSSTRGLTDQPDYLANADLTFDHEALGLRVSVIYYRFGPSLTAASLADSYDIYTQEYDVIDLTATKRFGRGFSVSASVKNLTDSIRETFYDAEGIEVARDRYRVGRSFSVSASLDF